MKFAQFVVMNRWSQKITTPSQWPQPSGSSATNPYCHAVETLQRYQHDCVGASNAFVWLCTVSGIRTRRIVMIDPNSAEAFIDGRWYFVENTPDRIKQAATAGGDKGPMFQKSYQELTIDENSSNYSSTHNGFPSGYAHRDIATYAALNHHAYKAFVNGSEYYDPTKIQPYSAVALGALMPSDTVYFKIPKVVEPKVHLTHYSPQREWETGAGSYKVTTGIRKRFYLAGRTGVKKVTANVLLTSDNNVPANGGSWYLKVNGHKVNITSWVVKRDSIQQMEKYVSFDLPLDLLNWDNGPYTDIPTTIKSRQPFAPSQGSIEGDASMFDLRGRLVRKLGYCGTGIHQTARTADRVLMNGVNVVKYSSNGLCRLRKVAVVK